MFLIQFIHCNEQGKRQQMLNVELYYILFIVYLKGFCCTLPLDGSVCKVSVGGYMAAQI